VSQTSHGSHPSSKQFCQTQNKNTQEIEQVAPNVVFQQMVPNQDRHDDHLQWQRVPWHIGGSPSIPKTSKQSTLDSYKGFGKPGEPQNPLVKSLIQATSQHTSFC
jgi:hypothetical protein